MYNDKMELFRDIAKFPFRASDLLVRFNRDLLFSWIKNPTDKKVATTSAHFLECMFIPLLGINLLETIIPSQLLDLSGGIFDIVVPFGSVFLTIHAYTKHYHHIQEKSQSPHGNAKFATPDELKILTSSDQGIVFGKIKEGFGQYKLLCKPSYVDGHIVINGGSGLGKTKSVAIPTLFRWNGSAVVVDIKGDLSSTTRTFRSAFQKTFIFNPTDPANSCVYNPLDNVTNAKSAKELARVLIPSMKGNDAYFSDTAQGILASAVLHGKYQGKSLSEICRWIQITPRTEIMEVLMSSQVPKVKELAGVGMEGSENALGNVMSELRRSISEFVDSDSLEAVTSGQSDFSIQDLEEGATIYLTVPESEMESNGKVFGLIYTQIIKHLLDRGEGKTPPVLLMLDEFAQLGRLPNFEERIATLRSRNVHVMLFIQSFSQLDEKYGRTGRKIILDNCRYDLVLGVKDTEVAEYYTKLAGMTTAETISKSLSMDHEGIPRESQNISQMSTPLLRVEEWKKLEQPILFPFKSDPIQVEQTWIDPLDPILAKAIQADVDRLEKELEQQLSQMEQVPVEEEEEQDDVVPDFLKESSK